MKKAFLGEGLGLLISSIFSLALPAEATTHNITVNGSSFAPAMLTIEMGDTVIWENQDDFFPHTTTSDLSFFDPNYWNGLLASLGDTFDFTFNNAGTFTYHDESDTGTGTIIVQASGATPVIRLDSAHIMGGQFFFSAAGLTVGKTNVLEASTDLTRWVAIQTNIADGAALTFTNAASLPGCCFRLIELP